MPKPAAPKKRLVKNAARKEWLPGADDDDSDDDESDDEPIAAKAAKTAKPAAAAPAPAGRCRQVSRIQAACQKAKARQAAG